MILFKKPSQAFIHQFITEQQAQPFSYGAIGATRGRAPAGYVLDHSRVRLGSGATCLGQAKAALRRWEMFELGWVALCWPAAPLEAGVTVAVLVHALGLWSLNACRIVYLIDEKTGPVQKFGFAYGTLPDHLERGEERFTIEWNRSDGSVWYDILAFSRPNHGLAWVGYPVVRHLQRRFGRNSLAAMQRAVDQVV